MARSTRAPKLETRTSRLKLPVAKKPAYVRVAPGISLGYRRNETAGTWVLRVADGRGSSWTKRIGVADDFDDSDAHSVLTFWEAQTLAKAMARGAAPGSAPRAPLTVERAATAYLASLEIRNRRTAHDARLRLNRLFLPRFSAKHVSDLTRRQLEEWRDGLVRTNEDAEQRRRSQDTANRVLSIVKAMLNHAIGDPANGLSDDSAWRLVRPFQRVGRPREVHFTVAEVLRLLDGCEDACFRDLLTAGFLTGARYGELAACQVRHFDTDGETLHVPSGKTGARTIILQPEAVTFFARLASNRPHEAPLLSRTDGAAWGPSHQVRPMKRALVAAKLDPTGTFYALRHSYISRAIEAGVPLNVVAENCGTSVRMIETTYAKVLAAKRREFITMGAPRLFAA
ncbi:tyrosine-type recombinase/integrase [Methylobacterium oxalidis]|uniref:Phage-related integrase n=1 Tax=Methylobacterium oxalidis TaxID=944322 RepID=A0A512JCD3_9HYPH|nr:tyrosine-type recombinase/integrase [Methylobacterium oxalidis]GEP07602.1 phage-related integrase [Methylobacterium oxalidis]GJE33466.1 Tyrosine recombinase XerC [Methylobacterium oxalidis]GLS66187.1 phage-related integrase [Methylobacterium oxalidis]